MAFIVLNVFETILFQNDFFLACKNFIHLYENKFFQN